MAAILISMIENLQNCVKFFCMAYINFNGTNYRHNTVNGILIARDWTGLTVMHLLLVCQQIIIHCDIKKYCIHVYVYSISV